jgi:phage virion morphogenesis protein
MFGIQFNAGASRAALRRAIEALGPAGMRPLYEEIGEHMIRATEQRFQKGTAPDGSRWARKSQTTLERYKALGYGNKPRPLIRSGALAGTILKSVTPGGVLIGSSLIYSGVMQDGAAKGAFGKDRRGRPIPWGRIPPRVWLGLSAEDDAAIVEIAEEHIGRALGSGAAD